MSRLMRIVPALCSVLVFCAYTLAAPAQAVERSRIEAFLNVTGFDVALDSIALSAASAPQMLGMPADEFGADWKRLTDKVFDTAVMREIALNILEQTLSDDMLTHAAGFYASDLGQRLVVAENATHMIEDDQARNAEGAAIVARLVEEGSPRLDSLKRMNAAIDSDDSGLRALQEVQIRFLLSASAAGVIKLNMDADQLRAAIQEQESELRLMIRASALANSAYTYQDFSDADVDAYAGALEQPLMRRVYELLNAVQYEIMANRFEVLAGKMAELHPSQDI